MALKEQANKKKSPRNKDGQLRDGKPLEKNILRYENRNIDSAKLFAQNELEGENKSDS